MSTTVTMPQLGESVTEGTVTRWFKGVGDHVEMDEDLYEISTDKVDTEVPSPYTGYVEAILVAEGETVPIGTPLCQISETPPSTVVRGLPRDDDSESTLPPMTPPIPAPQAAPVPGAAAPEPPPIPPLPPLPPAPPTPGALPPAAETSVMRAIPLEDVEAAPRADESAFADAVGEAVSEVESIERPRATIRMQYGDAQREHSLHAQPSQMSQPPPPLEEQPLHAHPVEGVDVESIGAEQTTKPRAHVTAEGEKRLAEPVPPEELKHDGSRRGILSPVVRKLAAEHNVNLDKITGTGTGGRVTRDDVLAAAGEPTAPAPPGGPALEPEAGVADRESAASREEPLSVMRMRIAEHMRESRQSAAHVFMSIEVNCDQIHQTRMSYLEAVREEDEISLTYLPFFALAICNALLEWPVVNSRIDLDARSATYFDHVNLGVAVDLEGEGLVVPVIDEADQLTLRELARRIADLADRARSKRLNPDEVQGGTFTITNPGPFGTHLSVPIINYPEVAILSLEGVAERPIVRDGALAVGRTTVLGLSWDHRAFDGSIAARFLAGLKDRIETWDWQTLAG